VNYLLTVRERFIGAILLGNSLANIAASALATSLFLSLFGEAGRVALRTLSALPFPATRPAFLQGAVAGGPAKLLLLAGVAYLLVPYPLRDHLERRLREIGGAEARIAAEESPFAGFAAAG